MIQRLGGNVFASRPARRAPQTGATGPAPAAAPTAVAREELTMRRRARSTSLICNSSCSSSLVVPAVARAQSPTAGSEVKVTPAPPPESLPVAGAPQPPLAPPPPAPETRAAPRAAGRRRPPSGAASPAPPAEAKPPNPPAGYIPGTGFVIQSPDLNFRMRIGLVAGYKFEPTYADGAWQQRNTFFVLRPFLGGNFFRDWIHFWTSFEFAANPPYLLDSYVEFAPSKLFTLRVGQQWTPFDRHEYFGPQEILFPEWAPVSEYFWSGRDKGFTALGTLAEQLDYYLGVYSGTPLRQYNALPGNYVLEARFTWNPLGPTAATEFPYIVSEGPVPFRVSATLQGYYGKVQSATENFNPSTFRFETEATGETNAPGRGRRGLLAADGRGSTSTSTGSSAAPSRPWPRGTRRSASGGRSVCRSSPRRWTSRPGSTGSTPASTSATTTSTRSRDSSRTTSRTRRGWS